MLIKQLHIETSRGSLKAEIELSNNATNHEFGFQLFRNGEEINYQKQLKQHFFHFNLDSASGYYFVRAHVKDNNGITDQRTSSPVFINPIHIDVYKFKSLNNHEAIVHSGKDWEVPILFYPNEQDRLFVLTPSAINRSKSVLPAFTRFTWAARHFFPGKVLCISDPTLKLHNRLGLSWCMGTTESDLSNELAQLVEEIARSYKINNRNIIFWGSSSGGFSALALSARIRDSTAVAINPQTDALAYKVEDQVQLIKKVVFNNASDQYIRDNYSKRINMLKLREESRQNRNILVQNILDEHHFEFHFTPYWEGLGYKIQEGWTEFGDDKSLVYRDIRGHVAETETMVQDIVKMIL